MGSDEVQLFHARESFRVSGNAADRLGYYCAEFSSETGALVVIPEERLGEIRASGGMKDEARRHAPRLNNSFCTRAQGIA
jgi:hypothetical protein